MSDTAFWKLTDWQNAVLKLTAERDALKADVERYREIIVLDRDGQTHKLSSLLAERDRVRQEALTRIDALAVENERLRKLIAEGDFKDLYAEGLTVGQQLGRAEGKTHLTELREAASALQPKMNVADPGWAKVEWTRIEAMRVVLDNARLEQLIEGKIDRGEAHYWDTFDKDGNVVPSEREITGIDLSAGRDVTAVVEAKWDGKTLTITKCEVVPP